MEVRINISVLKQLVQAIKPYKKALEEAQGSVIRVQSRILLSYSSGLWTSALFGEIAILKDNIRSVLEELTDIEEIVTGYITDSEKYIRPERESQDMLVDDWDIGYNLTKMADSFLHLQMEIESETRASTWSNSSKEEDPEAIAREKENAKKINEMLALIPSCQREMTKSYDKMERIYKNNVKQFIAVDKEYGRKAAVLYQKYSSNAEQRADNWDMAKSFAGTFRDTIKEFPGELLDSINSIPEGVKSLPYAIENYDKIIDKLLKDANNQMDREPDKFMSNVLLTATAAGAVKAIAKGGKAFKALANSKYAKSNVFKIKYKPSSGVALKTTPGKTTTVLGTYSDDTGKILDELGNVKSTDFGARKGGFNLLNTPDKLYKNANQFWNEYNKPWLDNAIKRNDVIIIATKPTKETLTRINVITNKREVTGFGREYKYLIDHGYRYDSKSGKMIKGIGDKK